MYISISGERNIPFPFAAFDNGRKSEPLIPDPFRHTQNTTKQTMTRRATTPPPTTPAISPTFVDVVGLDELEGDAGERDAKPGFPVTLPQFDMKHELSYVHADFEKHANSSGN